MKRISLILAAVFLCFLIAADQGFSAPITTVTVKVNGLVCDFCARALEKIFSKQDSVENIEVDLTTKMVTD